MMSKTKPATIALISDVHGNLPALEAVLSDIVSRQTDAIWNLGDMLGYAPFPNEVIAKLKDAAAVNIIGNYDRKVLDFASKRDQWKKRKAPAKYAAFSWNDAHLRQAARTFLASLPDQMRCKAGGLDALLVHGSPASLNELLGADTPQERLAELGQIARADLIVCGHSHEPFVRRSGRQWFVNPGSVGRPEGGDWRASYAIVKVDDTGVEVDQRRVVYDVERVARAVHAAGLPLGFIDVFRQARSLDQLSGESKVLPDQRQEQREKVMRTVLALAQRCNYEREHTHQVTKLALELFDVLKDLHRMGSRERFWLECGSLLHDIGWSQGQQGHHKAAMRLIAADVELALESEERRIVGLIARYHRKALPSERHKAYANLSSTDRNRVRVLAAILRVADALDRSHCNAVHRLRCRVSDNEVVVICAAQGMLAAERAAVAKKADLFEDVFERRLVVELQVDAE